MCALYPEISKTQRIYNVILETHLSYAMYERNVYWINVLLCSGMCVVCDCS